jgi:hypothetical protein
MSGVSLGLSANGFKTALDKVFYAKFNPTTGPQMGRVTMSELFQQDKAYNSAVIMEVFKGVGSWEETQEQEAYKGEDPRINDQITFSVVKYTKKFAISEEALEDDQVSLVKNAIADMGRMGNFSQEKAGFNVYKNAASTTLCADGVALLSASHANLAGDTIDNTISGALTLTTFKEGLNLLLEQKNQAGEILGHEVKTILVPNVLFDDATVITESELIPGDTDNDINVISNKYNVRVLQSVRIGATAGGSDTRYFMLGENHSITRWVRTPISTKLIPPENEANGDTIYRGRFREVYGAVSYEGCVGYEV